MKPLQRAAIFALIAAGVTALAQPPTPATKPNIVFILVDNLGYGELGVYGGGILHGAPTPRIDKLAAEPCAPSRRITGHWP